MLVVTTAAASPSTTAAAQTQPPAPVVAPAPRFFECSVADAACVPPSLVREFRGVWLATVGNMDWPSRPGLHPDSARLELTRLLDHAAATGLNAVIFHVRPAGDALYASTIEPWSEYLTGRQGLAPAPPWDPLAFAVTEAHARGLELHAWFNPYRAKDPTSKGPLAAQHLARRNPGYAMRYGRYTWFDPGEPAVRRHTVRVVLDVLNRYDVDGIHVDDYFYPYPEQRRGRDIPFPDATRFRRYQRAGGTLELDDWRRNNVDVLIDTLHTEIAKAKPWVKFGISPFGIWRPGEPARVRGLDAFARIYADAKKWLENGWVDYLVPQLYWTIDADGQPFAELLRWWIAQNAKARHVWPGLADYKIGESRTTWRSDEILRQIDTTRAVVAVGNRGTTPGAVHFQMTALVKDRGGVSTLLAQRSYATRALVPASPWMGDSRPGTPGIAVATSRMGDVLIFARRSIADVRWWAVQARSGESWTTHLIDGAQNEAPLARFAGTGGGPAEILAVAAVSRTGVAGAPVAIRVR